jgi:hypothetical protein
MRVFVLCTGRCGSTTFARACGPIVNYSSAHESRSRLIGDARLDYPDQHIEVDNRLSWFLGPLEEKFGERAFYVHLHRDSEAVARSHLRRWHKGITQAFAHQIVMRWKGNWPEADRLDVCRFYVDVVTSNIRTFLANKDHVSIDIARPVEDFVEFWERIGAKGDLSAALAEFQVRHNQSRRRPGGVLGRFLRRAA